MILFFTQQMGLLSSIALIFKLTHLVVIHVSINSQSKECSSLMFNICNLNQQLYEMCLDGFLQGNKMSEKSFPYIIHTVTLFSVMHWLNITNLKSRFQRYWGLQPSNQKPPDSLNKLVLS